MTKILFKEIIENKIEETAQYAADNRYSPIKLIQAGIMLDELDCLLDDVFTNSAFSDEFFAEITDKDVDNVLKELDDSVAERHDGMSTIYAEFEYRSKIGAKRMTGY